MALSETVATLSSGPERVIGHWSFTLKSSLTRWVESVAQHCTFLTLLPRQNSRQAKQAFDDQRKRSIGNILSSKLSPSTMKLCCLLASLVITMCTACTLASDSIPSDAPASVRRMLLKRQAQERVEQESTAKDSCEDEDPSDQYIESLSPPISFPMPAQNNINNGRKPPPPTRSSLPIENPFGLSKLHFDIGDGPELALVYKQNFSADSNNKCPSKGDEVTEESHDQPYDSSTTCSEDSKVSLDTPAVDKRTCGPSSSGDKTMSTSSLQICKFFNLSNRTLHLIWKHGESVHDLSLIKKMEPLTTHGTTCTSNHTFLLLDMKNPEKPAKEIRVGRSQQRLYVFDDHSIPKYVDEFDHNGGAFAEEPNHLQRLSEQYEAYQKTLKYARLYEKATGNPFLSNYGSVPPSHFQYPCDRVGREFSVAEGQVLRVVSTAPCALEVEDLLSQDECDAIRELAQKQGLHESETITARLNTRTSFNTWIQPSSPTFRNTNDPRLQEVVDRIFSKAAKALRIPHDIFLNVTEPFQVVSYSAGQEYQGHVDFSFPPISHPQQPTRFATMLFYLNGGEEARESSTGVNDEEMLLGKGGETEFPLAKPCPIKVTPKTGKAVLFYSQLPDGNMDERSLHAALPVINGTKWLANLWVWNPIMDLTLQR